MERRRDPNDGHYHQQRRGYDVEPLRRPGEIHDKNNNCASNPNHNNHRELKMRSFRGDILVLSQCAAFLGRDYILRGIHSRFYRRLSFTHD